MIRNLSQRLERLEEQLAPLDEILLVHHRSGRERAPESDS